MGQNESKAPPKHKINHSNGNSYSKTYGIKPSSSGMSNDSAVNNKEFRPFGDKDNNKNENQRDSFAASQVGADPNKFTKGQSTAQKEKEQLTFIHSRQPLQNDKKESFLVSENQSQIQKDDDEFILFSGNQQHVTWDKNTPGVISKTQPQSKEDKNQWQKDDIQQIQLFTSQSLQEKDGLFPKSQHQDQDNQNQSRYQALEGNNENQSLPFFTIQPEMQRDPKYSQEEKNDTHPGLLTMTQPEEQKDDNHSVVFATSKQVHQDFDKQPLFQNSKKINETVAFQVNHIPRAGSIPTKALEENTPSKKIISSGNPFLQSVTKGMVAKDISPIKKSCDNNLPQVEETKINFRFNSLKVPNLDPSKGFDIPSGTSRNNLSVGAVKKKGSTLRAPKLKGSTKDEVVKQLKHVEKIAEGLRSANINQPQQVLDPQNKKRYDFNLKLCIVKLNNVRDNDKDYLSCLQKELVAHLKEIATFTSFMHSSSVINFEILSICETIRENLNLLKTNFERKNNPNTMYTNSTAKEELFKSHESQNQINFPIGNERNVIALTDHEETKPFVTTKYIDGCQIADTNEIRKEVSTKSDDNETDIPHLNRDIDYLNHLLDLLDQLPDDLIDEKQYISYRNSYPYCNICEKSIAFVSLNLIEHLRGRNHRAISGAVKKSTFDSRVEFPRLLNQTTASESNVEYSMNACQTQTEGDPAVNFNLSPNYKDVLNLIMTSVERGLDFSKLKVYICLLCDSFENDETKALSHVSTDHKDQLNLNAEWFFCETCLLNMYGTNSQFNEHQLTVQHINIAKLIRSPERLPREEIANDTISGTDEFDRGSVCSSKSDTSNRSHPRMKPHEILLAIAKDKKCKNVEGPFGLYCDVCRKYELIIMNNESKNLSSHLATKSHVKFLEKHKFKKNLKFKKCETCDVYLFGDNDVWKEHQNLQIHKELAVTSEERSKRSKLEENIRGIKGQSDTKSSKTCSFLPLDPNISDNRSCGKSILDKLNSNDSDCLSSFNEKGPHYELMKTVLKKHLSGSLPKNDFFGSYCHVCQLYFLDQNQWGSHLLSSSHRTKLDSSECRGKKMEHVCVDCNVRLICDEQFLFLHSESLLHKAVMRIPGKKRQADESESDEDYSEDEYSNSESNEENGDSEGNAKVEENRNSNNINSGGKTSNKLALVQKGIYLKGTPKSFTAKDVSEYFKTYGPLQSCNADKLRGTASIVFKHKINATIVLQQKNPIIIKGSPVTVRPLMGKPKVVKERVELPPGAGHLLSSRNNVEDAVSKLITEVMGNYGSNQNKGALIKKDLSEAIPGCRVLFFGSQVTGLATNKSDFDIYIDFDGKSFYKDLTDEHQQQIIEHLYYVLTQRGSTFLVKEMILEARVPIIKVVHKQTNTPCDISCRSGLSVENSQLIRVYLDMDPRVRWLVVAVKFWMEGNGLLDRNVFTSYATVWLVLFFLMRVHKPVICPVVTLQMECRPHTVAKWDCRFHRDKKDIQRFFRTTNQMGEVELLAGFFHFYASCPFRGMVLCPLNGRLIPRKQFETLSLPEEFKPYTEKFQFFTAWEKLRLQTPVCLQDPFDLSHNVTKGVNRNDLSRFKELCKLSYMMCQNCLTR